LGNYFASVFTVEGNNNNYNKLPPKLIKYQYPNVVFSKEKFLEKLKDLNTSKSHVPDSIHPRILWEIRNEIVQPLHIIFETSFRLGTLPQDWRSANITAIHKKGNKAHPSNYRPVSLTSIVYKIMESIIRDTITDFFFANNFFSNKQFGFIKGRPLDQLYYNCYRSWMTGP